METPIFEILNWICRSFRDRRMIDLLDQKDFWGLCTRIASKFCRFKLKRDRLTQFVKIWFMLSSSLARKLGNFVVIEKLGIPISPKFFHYHHTQ